MTFRFIFSLVLALLWATTGQAQRQEDNPILFFVEDQEIRTDEFTYIYSKNNRDQSLGSRESLAEYLQLYITFKLKVQAAKEAGLDTVKSLQNELDMYRDQLAKNYLIDKEVEEQIAREVYDRMKEDLHLSHLLLQVEKRADSTMAYSKIQMIRDSILSGEQSFDDMARKYSQDRASASKGGDLGYLTAMFPDGFEALEEEAYQMKEGEVSNVVRSRAGYHLLYLHDRRPARGSVEISHILVRKEEGKSAAAAKMKAENIYLQLEKGMPWDKAVATFSEDNKTKRNSGFLGKFEIGIYEQPLEDAAFALSNEGDYSKPIESSVGFHILRRGTASRPQAIPFAESRPTLIAELKQTNRLKVAEQKLVEEIIKRSDFVFHDKVYHTLEKNIGEDLTSYRWKEPTVENETLVEFGDKFSRSTIDFTNYLKQNTRERLRLSRLNSHTEALAKMKDQFIAESALDYEQQFLADKYPEFKHLMREYREGILLFEITRQKVWDKASTDTVGLRNFYASHKDNYMWPPRLQLYSFRAKGEDVEVVKELQRQLSQKGVSEVISEWNKDSTRLTYSKKLVERSSDEILKNKRVGDVFHIKPDNESITFDYLAEIVPPSRKTLEEAKGFVISDYQKELERQWVQHLRESYRVKVVDSVFDEVVSSYNDK